MFVKPVLVVIGEDLETILPQILCIVKDSFHGSPVVLMAHVHSEPVSIVQFWVVGDKKSGNELAKVWYASTKKC